jgi:cytochrome P450 family 6
VISNVAFGIDSNCKCKNLRNFLLFYSFQQIGLDNPNSEFFKYGQRLFNFTAYEFLKILISASAPGLSRRIGLTTNPTEAADFLLKAFTQTIKERETSKVQRNDFVQLLLNIRESVGLTNNELAAEAFIFFIGGFETSSTALAFAMYELALNQDVQQKLRSEIQDGLEGNDGKLTYDMLFGFKYLECVVKETLRKYPVIPFMLRQCTKEYKIPGTDLVIPEKSNILLPFYSIHHNPDYYPSPEVFDPERFSPENSKDRNPMTFLAFGEGPRGCIGERFGLLQVKVGLVKLLTNFDIAVCHKTTIPMKFKPNAPFIAPIDGMWLKIKRLN